MDKLLQLKIINFDNPYKIEYSVLLLPRQLEGAEIIDISLKATQSIAPILVKYVKDKKYYLSKISFNDLLAKRDFEWTY